MGLDAVVFCDCVEKDRLKNPHPFPRLLYIATNGSPEIRSDDPAKVELHDAWTHRACAHEDMMIVGEFLGNAWSIGFLRETLQAAVRAPMREFPVLWNKVIYSGTHCGDYLTRTSVLRLAGELQRVHKIDFEELCVKKRDLEFIQEFQSKITRIVKMAIKINKPVAF